MNTFALEIWDDEGAKCKLYTVRKEDAEFTETDKFLNKIKESKQHREQLLQLIRLITESIANKYGAIDDFFTRWEGKGHALPPKPKAVPLEIKDLGINFPLRLYCYRVNEQTLILFNGGVKESQENRDSPDIHIKFQELQKFVSSIEDALYHGELLTAANGYIMDREGNNNNLELLL